MGQTCWPIMLFSHIPLAYVLMRPHVNVLCIVVYYVFLMLNEIQPDLEFLIVWGDETSVGSIIISFFLSYLYLWQILINNPTTITVVDKKRQRGAFTNRTSSVTSAELKYTLEATGCCSPPPPPHQQEKKEEKRRRYKGHNRPEFGVPCPIFKL